MSEYHKIQTIFKRDPTTNRIIVGDYSLPEFGYLADNRWSFTEKVDGTNIRLEWSGSGEPVIGGRTDNAQIPAPLVAAIQDVLRANPGRFAEVFRESEAVLYGEGYGGRIQAGGRYRPDASLVLFDVRVGKWWLERPDLEDVAAKFGLDVVPVVLEGTLADAVAFVADGFQSAWGEFPAEGLVGVPAVGLFNRSGHRIVAKIKTRDFAHLHPVAGMPERATVRR